ncbi:hypothetical protein C8Q76DRAFT_799609 [Earliella scabrosa]|nr:hypothetical protein C8Q76DRAFT_799609 [Earliella scabrosa]
MATASSPANSSTEEVDELVNSQDDNADPIAQSQEHDDGSSNGPRILDRGAVVLPAALRRGEYPEDLEVTLAVIRSNDCEYCAEHGDDCEQTNGQSWKCKGCLVHSRSGCDWHTKTGKSPVPSTSPPFPQSRAQVALFGRDGQDDKPMIDRKELKRLEEDGLHVDRRARPAPVVAHDVDGPGNIDVEGPPSKRRRTQAAPSGSYGHSTGTVAVVRPPRAPRTEGTSLPAAINRLGTQMTRVADTNVALDASMKSLLTYVQTIVANQSRTVDLLTGLVSAIQAPGAALPNFAEMSGPVSAGVPGVEGADAVGYDVDSLEQARSGHSNENRPSLSEAPQMRALRRTYPATRSAPPPPEFVAGSSRGVTAPSASVTAAPHPRTPRAGDALSPRLHDREEYSPTPRRRTRRGRTSETDEEYDPNASENLEPTSDDKSSHEDPSCDGAGDMD